VWPPRCWPRATTTRICIHLYVFVCAYIYAKIS
jgi:hypothetical protein